MPYDKHTGISRLAQVMSKRMKKESEPDICLDFGFIDSVYNLQTDLFPELIPKGDYYVCRSLVMGKKGAKFAGVQDSLDQETDHYVPVPEQMQSLLPGDRVLVAWVGAIAVVIDILISATTL